jgi:molybdopterin synthase catalytic subunit
MDITKTLAELKKRPGFADRVGMMLVHNGVVRAFSRNGNKRVASILVTPDHQLIGRLCREFERRPGIFCIVAEAAEGTLYPGDDLLFLVVAGDIRENVKTVFAELLEAVKSQAVAKVENLIPD